jgi:hypothetical protein
VVHWQQNAWGIFSRKSYLYISKKMNIQERYVSFETSKLLKEKGFEWRGYYFNRIKQGETVTKDELRGYWSGNVAAPFSNTCYNGEGVEITPKYYNPNNPHYPRPTLAMANEWIMNHQKVFINIVCHYFIETSWGWEVISLKNEVLNICPADFTFDHWYDAYDEGLRAALTL